MELIELLPLIDSVTVQGVLILIIWRMLDIAEKVGLAVENVLAKLIQLVEELAKRED